MPTLRDKLLESLTRHGDRSAFSWRGNAYSYAELSERAQTLASHFHAYECAPIFLNMPRTFESVAAMIAAVLSSNYIVPLDGRAIADHHAKIINLHKPGLLVESGLEISPTDSTHGAAPERSSAPVAYSIYTSGTTGSSKSILVSCANLLSFIEDISVTYEISPDDRILGFADFGFDVAMYEIFGATLNGATLCLFDRTDVGDPSALKRFIQDQQVSVAEIPPVLLPYLDPAQLPSLRLVSVGGEQTPQAEVDRWMPRVTLFNGYGPAECTIAFMQHKYQPGDPANCIGMPVGGNEVVVVDAEGKEVAPGGSGELCVAGPYVGIGYTNAPFETVTLARRGYDRARAFYRTGDIISQRDGKYFYEGRNDDVVKRNGVRISLSEIDSVICCHSAVTSSRSILVDRLIVSFLIPGDHFRLDAFEEEIAANFRLYTAPNRFVVLKSFPVTKNGKIDTARLFEMALDELSSNQSDAASNYPEMETLKAIVEDVLRRTCPETADLFSLGISSIDILTILHSIEMEFEVNIPYHVFASAPTLKNLAEFIKCSSLDEAETEYVGQDRDCRDGKVECYTAAIEESQSTPSQIALERVIARTPNLDFTHVDSFFMLDGTRVDIEAYVSVISQAFETWSNKPHVFLGHHDVPEFSNLNPEQHRQFLTRLVDDLSFATRDEDCHRFCVFWSDATAILFFRHTHTDVDGYSISRFIQTINDIVDRKTPSGACEWDRSALESIYRPLFAKLNDDLSTVVEPLRGLDRIPKPKINSWRNQSDRRLVFEEQTSRALARRSKELKVSLASLLCCLTKDWITEIFDHPGVAMWVTMDGRVSSKLDAVNYTANCLPTYFDKSASPNTIHNTILTLKKFQHVPAELVLDALVDVDVEREDGGTGAIPFLFAYQDCGTSTLRAPNLVIRSSESVHLAPIFEFYRILLGGLAASVAFTLNDSGLVEIRVEQGGGVDEIADAIDMFPDFIRSHLYACRSIAVPTRCETSQ